MAGDAINAKPGPLQFTEREIKLMASAFQCMKAAADIDLEKLADLMGYTNMGSARNAMAELRKKLASANSSAGTAPVVTPRKRAAAKPKTPKTRKTEDDGEIPVKPSTKRKRNTAEGGPPMKKGKQVAGVKAESHDENDFPAQDHGEVDGRFFDFNKIRFNANGFRGSPDIDLGLQPGHEDDDLDV